LYLIQIKKKKRVNKMQNITRVSQFDEKNVNYSDVRVNSFGGKSIYLNYLESKRSLVLQTPQMVMPYNVGEFQPLDSSGNPDGNKKYTMNLSFRSMEDDPKVKLFYEKITALDDKLVTDAVKNSLPWFKANHKREVINALYSPTVKVSKDRETGEADGKYPPTIKIKLPTRDDKFMCEVYNSKREEVDLLETLGKGAQVKALIQCTGVWFAGGKFGLSWKVVQMKVVPSKKIKGYSFIDESDDEDGEGETKESESKEVESDDELDEGVVDEDVEVVSESESEEEDEEEKPPTPKKKVKRRKKTSN
jgi:hypothetical protein